MDQRVPNKRDALASLIAFVSSSVAQARVVEKPFFHLVFDRVFPDDIYDAMVDTMPNAADYRPLWGRNKGNMREDGTSTRVKIDLFPEYIRHLPPEKRTVWDQVGRALCSEEVKHAFVRTLAPGLPVTDAKKEKTTYHPVSTKIVSLYAGNEIVQEAFGFQSLGDGDLSHLGAQLVAQLVDAPRLLLHELERCHGCRDGGLPGIGQGQTILGVAPGRLSSMPSLHASHRRRPST